MERDIFLIGAGQTQFGERWNASLRNLMEEAITAALDDAPCTSLDVDIVVVSNMLAERVNSQAHLGALAASILPHHPPALRVESACASGAVALHTACSLLESGRAQNVLVVGVEKMTDTPSDEIAAALMGAADAEKDAPSGITFPGLFGLIAERYMHEYGLTREELSYVSTRHHERALKNPYAQFRKSVTSDQVSASPLVADPIRLLDCSPITDGAAACLLSTSCESSLKISASQLTSDTTSIADRTSITSFPATKDAAERAFEEATIQRSDVSVIELHDCFSIAALLSLEDLGFAEPGQGIELYKNPPADLQINGSGGLKACGHPVGATGIKQLIEVGRQLKQQKEQWGLAHNFGGAGVTCGVHILEHSIA